VPEFSQTCLDLAFTARGVVELLRTVSTTSVARGYDANEWPYAQTAEQGRCSLQGPISSITTTSQ
jgi:hypothetical protein